jgi:hypothetical protein
MQNAGGFGVAGGERRIPLIIQPCSPPPPPPNPHPNPNAADARLATTSPALTLVGPAHIHGTARLEDGRPSVDLGVKGAWQAAADEGGGGKDDHDTGAAPPLCGTWAIPRIVTDPEFAGGLGPLSTEMTVDAEGGQGGEGGARRLGGVREALAAELVSRVKAAVAAGLAEAGAAKAAQ